ncbi:MAG: DUF4845 domain-containing protein [Burkholderiaceae bacterium]
MGLISLLIAGVIVGFVIIVGMQVFPTTKEFFAIRKAVQRAAQEGGGSIADIQRSFDKAAQIDDFTAISGKDLIIRKVGDKMQVDFAYEKRIPLFGPASLLLDYRGSATQ